MANLKLGKQWGLRRMATPSGHFTMVALDQRPPIANLIGKKRGIPPQDAPFADMIAVKRVLVDALGSHCSAMLFDPNYAFPAGLEKLPAHTGLVVTLEDHRFKDTPGGRVSHSINDWSVEKIKRAGGDGVKVLAWYRPDAEPEVAEHQRRYVEAIGAECRTHDIPLVLELLVYPFPKSDKHTLDYVESPEKMPQLVLDSVQEFAHPRYGVDLFKLESPLPGAGLPAHGEGDAARQAQNHFDDMGAICKQAGIPWVMLSAGVTPQQFVRVMQYAYAAGAHGFLAGRAIWWEALQHFPDLAAFEA
ncbi:MAG: tagatose 1,6-diphosphate aldolase, partial [Gammaproteobacteria bacterium]|nr:tagatose 1,6-diphosphate aldolase [Gammaproteobacteria bacterium]